MIARIKCNNRYEISKFVFGVKKTFKFKEVTYHIDPNCIYRAYKFLLFAFNYIDFVQGSGKPIDFYSGGDVVSTKKNLDTINMIVGNWLRFSQRIIKYILIICVVILIAVIINIIIPFVREVG